MSADDDRWLEIAGLILDGKPVAWDRIPDRGPEDDVSADALRVIAEVADLHRAPAGESARRWGTLAIEEQIGHGTFGDVYRARDAALDRDVALKLVDYTPSATAPDEGRLLARVRHSNVVTVHGAAIHDGRYGIWMEFIRGRTLAAIVREHGPLAAEEVTAIGIDVCRALTAVHESGLLHGDIKPQNVMREDGGRIVVMDFGTGRVVTGGAAADRLAGTPLYLAPEVLSGSAPDVRADVYSTGVLLYYLLTGTYPVEGSTLDEVRAAHARGERTPVRSRRPEMPRPMAAIIERAIAVEPSGRFESTANLERALRDCRGTRARRSASAQPAWRRVGRPVAAALALVLIAGVWRAFHREPLAYRIAVLPLRNLGTDSATEYFSDGLTDEITRELSRIDGLTVTSRTSSFVFKGRARDLRDVARQLNVNLVLEGTVLREGDRLGVDVDLVRAPDDATLWSRHYDRELNDIFSVQDEISRAIVNELRLKYVGGQRRYSLNTDAYDLYLRARFAANAGDFQASRQAIALYQQVIAKDAGFAPAYAGMAAAYSYLRLPRAQMPDADQRMRAAAERAIELDPMLAEAYGALAIVQAEDLAWSDAEHTFEHALLLDPNAAIVHRQFGMLVLLPEGRMAAAVQRLREALALDPLSSSTKSALALGLLTAGAYDEALEQSHPLMAAKPTDPKADLQVYGRSLWFSGRHEEAIRVLEGLGTPSHGFLGYAYAQAGRREDALTLAKEPDPAATRHQALIAAGLGDKDGVFEALHRMAAERDVGVDLFPLYPEFAFVRDDSRMAALRHGRHLPWPP